MRFSHLEIITYCLIIIVCACHFCAPAMVLDLLIESSQSLVLVHDAEHIARLYSIRQPLNISLAPCQLFNVPVLIYLFPFGQIHSFTPWHICLHLLSPGLKCPCVRKGGQVRYFSLVISESQIVGVGVQNRQRDGSVKWVQPGRYEGERCQKGWVQ